MDVSVRALEIASRRLRIDDLPSFQAERIKLLHGSLTYRDKRLAGFDAAVVVLALTSPEAPITIHGLISLSIDPDSDVRDWAVFFELTPNFFTIAYCLFGAIVLATSLMVPPNFLDSRFVRRPSD